VSGDEEDHFLELLAELSDGQRWQLARSSGWEDFAVRLSDLIVTLPPRRRQVLVMLLFALSERMVTPDQAAEWIGSHNLDRDEGLDATIGWLRGLHAGFASFDGRLASGPTDEPEG
jgi:hypothetical protein